MLTALGITVPAAFSRQRAFILGGGVIGAALGIVILGVLGFDPFQVSPAPTVPPPLLLAFGGLVGLLMAFSITWAERRWPVAEK
jgi:hypothetical protein